MLLPGPSSGRISRVLEKRSEAERRVVAEAQEGAISPSEGFELKQVRMPNLAILGNDADTVGESPWLAEESHVADPKMGPSSAKSAVPPARNKPGPPHSPTVSDRF